MIELLRGAALVTATVTTGLFAGVFFAFAIAVMPGLTRTDSATFVNAMREINAAILNPVFLLCFLGAPGLTALATALALGAAQPATLAWVALAFVLLAAVLVITFRINVPLNDELAAAGPGDPADVRRRFERRWVRWNNVRAVASTAALGSLALALVL